jgi:hypothetical protein
MYWIESKSVSAILFSFLLLISAQCSNDVKKDHDKTKKTEKRSNLNTDEKIARQVELELDINASEKYELTIHKEYINEDTLLDALILVNRKQWAHERANKAENKSFIEKTGFVGPYNHVFVKLGGEDQLLKTPHVGSAADYPLKSQFLSLTSLAHKDFYVNYRIRNSMHRNYYTVRNNRIYQTFSCPVFDSIGYEEPRVFAIRHEESSVRISKDIAIYKGKIVGYDTSQIENPNNYSPRQIIPLDELIVYFIFDGKSMKYKSPMVPPE